MRFITLAPLAAAALSLSACGSHDTGANTAADADNAALPVDAANGDVVNEDVPVEGNLEAANAADPLGNDGAPVANTK